jgi:hypothetical protein
MGAAGVSGGSPGADGGRWRGPGARCGGGCRRARRADARCCPRSPRCRPGPLPKSRATCPTDRSPRWHNSTISALNSGVNERRRRGFFLPMLSMVGHPSGGEPLMMDVRQSGPGPVIPRSARPGCHTVAARGGAEDQSCGARREASAGAWSSAQTVVGCGICGRTGRRGVSPASSARVPAPTRARLRRQNWYRWRRAGPPRRRPAPRSPRPGGRRW